MNENDKNALVNENAHATRGRDIDDATYAKMKRAYEQKMQTAERDLRRRMRDNLLIAKAVAMGIVVTKDEIDDAVAQFNATKRARIEL